MATDRRRRSSRRSRRRGVPHGFHLPGRSPAAASPDAGDLARPWWEARRCPDPGTFGAFLQDSLPLAEYERVYEHIDACPVCHQVFAQIVVVLDRIKKAKRADEEPPPRPARRTKPRPDGPPPLVDSPPPVVSTPPERVNAEIEPVAAAVRAVPRAPVARRALLAAGLGVAIGLIGLLIGWKLPARDPRVLLMATEPRERPWPARFRDVIWSPVGDPQPRTTGDVNLRPGAARYLVAAELRGPMPEAPSAQELAAIGAEQVLGGQVDPGVATLIRAVAAEPEAAELLSELGAARLARAESSAATDLDEAAALGRETPRRGRSGRSRGDRARPGEVAAPARSALQPRAGAGGLHLPGGGPQGVAAVPGRRPALQLGAGSARALGATRRQGAAGCRAAARGDRGCRIGWRRRATGDPRSDPPIPGASRGAGGAAAWLG